ncbi:MAG: protein phosphatase 2C domain-containing protein, partial [bacterium]
WIEKDDLSTAQPSSDPPPETPPKPGKKQLTRAELDLTFTETAKNEGEYLTYCHNPYSDVQGNSIDIFAARRIGLSHLRKNTHCQDACAYDTIPHGYVLLDGDGISACKYGEIGAQLACEAAGEEIKRMSRQTPDEDDFIRVLMSADFYREMREAWVTRVSAYHEKEVGQRDDRFLFNYGTTLLIAVVTRHWIATLNLGDGQILLFNESECQYARLAEKESPAPKSLIYGTYLEDVQRGLWPRSRYKGVLLTTDGVNDLLDRIPAFEGRTSGHNYALQITSRFLEWKEPYQPFVYSGMVLGERRIIDLSRQRGASDDCSIVLLVDGSYKSRDEGAIALLKRRYGEDAIVQLLRRVGERVCWLVSVQDARYMVYQTPTAELALRDPRLEHFDAGDVRAWRCEARWFIGSLYFSAYRMPEDVPGQTLEAEFQCATFNTVRQYHKAEDSRTGALRYVIEPLLGERMLRIHDALVALEEYLWAQNLYLRPNAPSWIVMLADEDDTMLVPKEAYSENPVAEEQPWQLTIGQLFPGFIGRMVCGEHSVPLFAPGNDILDVDYYLFDAKSDDEKGGR